MNVSMLRHYELYKLTSRGNVLNKKSYILDVKLYKFIENLYNEKKRFHFRLGGFQNDL
jgi:acyl-CoA-binding protein